MKLDENNYIIELEPNEVFIFGSNLAGLHYGGAAKTAHEKFGAVMGEGIGYFGQSYAFPTLKSPSTVVGVNESNKLPNYEILDAFDNLFAFVKGNPHLTFYLTDIGCGIAGFTYQTMGRLISYYYPFPKNLILIGDLEKFVNKVIVK